MADRRSIGKTTYHQGQRGLPGGILIIEDDPSLNRTLKMLLEKHGFNTYSARNGKEGIAYALLNRPSLILLDLKLPDISGSDVIRMLKRRKSTSYIPIIVASVVKDRDKIVDVLSLGTADYVVKPLSVQTLMPRIRKALGYKN